MAAKEIGNQVTFDKTEVLLLNLGASCWHNESTWNFLNLTLWLFIQFPLNFSHFKWKQLQVYYYKFYACNPAFSDLSSSNVYFHTWIFWISVAEDTNTVNIRNNINYHLCLSSPLLNWLDTRMDWPGQISHLIPSFISRGLEYTIKYATMS